MSPEGRPRTLYRRIYLHGVLLLVLVALALGVVGFFLGRGLLLGRDPRWRFHPALLAQHVAALLAPVPEGALPEVLSRLADDLDVDLAVYADGGRRVAAAGRRIPSPLDPAQALRLLGDGVLRLGHRDAACAAGPGRYLRLSLRRTEAEVLRRLVGSLAVVVLVVALVSLPLAGAIARPLEHLSRVARRLGEGDLAARSRLARSDEIGALARTFDEMAERLGRLLEGQRELLANVSHELRTPLARIRVALSLAAEAPPEEARRHLGEIERDVLELEQLVADVLTASRLDGGGALVLRRERVDPVGLVQEALERFERRHPGQAVEARVAPTPALDAEPALLLRVLDNLLDNAAKYSEPATSIAVGLAEREGGVVLIVRDRGIGIPAEDQPKVFQPFFRSDRGRGRDSGGVGLGLALSKRIVEAHGGRIGLDSAPGRGTTVTVWLPAAGAKAG